MTRRFFAMLAIFFCSGVLIRGACIEQSVALPAAVESFKHEVSEPEEEVAAEGKSLPRVEASEGSLARARLVIPVARSIRSTFARGERTRRDAAADVEVTSAFATRNGGALKNGKIPKLGDHVTKRHGKRRRRKHCKKRYGCSRLGHENKRPGRNGRGKRKEVGEGRTFAPVEQRKWFEHRPRDDRNSEGRVLVGNRPLALFRKELAAAAAVNVTRAETKTRRIQSRIATKASTKRGSRITNGTLGEAADKAPTRTTTRHDKLEGNGNAPGTSTLEASDERNIESHVHESLNSFDEKHAALTIVVKRVPRTKSITAK